MTVSVITLLTLFVVKWVSLEEEAGEVEISGVRSKLLLISHLTTSSVVVENGAHVPTTLKTIVTTARIYSLSATDQASSKANLFFDYEKQTHNQNWLRP